MPAFYKKTFFIWYSALFVIAVFFNFLWEVGHSNLYQWIPPMEKTLGHLFLFSVKDAVLYLIFIVLVAIAVHSILWFRKPLAWHLALLALAGFAVSAVIEYMAIDTGRWAYLPSMPIIPFLNVGLTPILQMSIGPIIVIAMLLLAMRYVQIK